ncbi:MAG TPA: phosphatase PAP2 family protein [Thermomicrobiales bacterium]|nr:phosphatase PAP2 family protein [Thermomicrobiales bacterium]
MNQRLPETLADLPSPSTSAGILLVLAGIASVLGFFARGEQDIWGDEAVLESIQAIDAPGLELAVRVSNFAFDTAGALLVAIVLVAVALLLRRPVFVLEMAVVIAFRVAVIVLKPLFASPRPGTEHHVDLAHVPETFGYPSGHAFTAPVVTGMFVLFIDSLNLPSVFKGIAIVLATLVTALGMFSRIWIGAHWPSNTIGGVLYGIAAVALMRIIASFIVLQFGSLFSTAARGRSLRR